MEREVPVSHWLTGASSAEITIPAEAGEVVQVTVDPGGRFPDIDPKNNVWVSR
jgi:hypothetical protein